MTQEDRIKNLKNELINIIKSEFRNVGSITSNTLMSCLLPNLNYRNRLQNILELYITEENIYVKLNDNTNSGDVNIKDLSIEDLALICDKLPKFVIILGNLMFDDNCNIQVIGIEKILTNLNTNEVEMYQSDVKDNILVSPVDNPCLDMLLVENIDLYYQLATDELYPYFPNVRLVKSFEV